MNLRSSLPLPVLLVSLGGASLAQGGVPPGDPELDACLPYDVANSLVWPNGACGPAASFGRTVVGLFSSASNTDRDAVTVAGGVVVHSATIAAYKLFDPIDFPIAAALTDVVDIAVLPGAGPGGTDALLATDGRGLLRTTYSSGAFTEPVVIESVAWVDAGPIHVVDADGLGGLDILGVAADGVSVLSLIDSGSGYVGDVITAPRPVMDAVVCNWDTDSALEIVVLTTSGLFAHSLDGTLEHVVPHAATSGAIARVRFSDGSDFVAWGRPKASGGGELIVLDRTAVDGTLDLEFDSCEEISFVPKAILAGDYNYDLEQDLALVHEADRSVVVLVNDGDAPHFSADDDYHDVVPLHPNPYLSGGVGLPAFVQVDGVGPDDLVVPVRVTDRLQVILNQARHRFLEVGGQGTPPTSKNVIDDQSTFLVNQTRQWRLTLKVPSQYVSYEVARVVLFKAENAGELVSSAPVRTDFNLVLDNGEVEEQWQYVDLQHDFPAAPSESYWSEPDRPYFYAEVRFVDNSGALSPRYYAGMTLRETETGTPTYSHLLPGGIPPLLDLGGDYSLPPDQLPTSEFVGAYIPMSSSPAFVNGERPEELLVTQPNGTAVVYTNNE